MSLLPSSFSSEFNSTGLYPHPSGSAHIDEHPAPNTNLVLEQPDVIGPDGAGMIVRDGSRANWDTGVQQGNGTGNYHYPQEFLRREKGDTARGLVTFYWHETREVAETLGRASHVMRRPMTLFGHCMLNYMLERDAAMVKLANACTNGEDLMYQHLKLLGVQQRDQTSESIVAAADETNMCISGRQGDVWNLWAADPFADSVTELDQLQILIVRVPYVSDPAMAAFTWDNGVAVTTGARDVAGEMRRARAKRHAQLAAAPLSECYVVEKRQRKEVAILNQDLPVLATGPLKDTLSHLVARHDMGKEPPMKPEGQALLFDATAWQKICDPRQKETSRNQFRWKVLPRVSKDGLAPNWHLYNHHDLDSGTYRKIGTVLHIQRGQANATAAKRKTATSLLSPLVRGQEYLRALHSLDKLEVNVELGQTTAFQ